VAALLALLPVLIAILAGVVAGYLPSGYRLWWVGLLVVLTVALVALTLVSLRQGGQVPVEARWQVPPLPTGFVDRAELAQLVLALTARGGGVVALSTGLVGAGGFGKTTLAAKACHDRAVRRRFRGGIWVTVGRDLNGAGLAARISEVVRNLGEGGPAFTSLEQAGQALAVALARVPGPLLLIADDVWTQAQLAPFLAAGEASCLLVTTRRPAVLDGAGARRIRVDQVSDAVAKRLLTRGLPPMNSRWVRELVGLAGGWPLLLSLINRRLSDDLSRGGTVDTAPADLAGRLRRDGPAAVDLSDAGTRQTAVAATVAYSLEVLTAAGRDRFSELGIFASDAEVPVPAVTLLWRGTTGQSEADTLALCERLDGLSLLSLAWAGNVRVVTVHDVIRDLVRVDLGPERLSELNGVLVDAAAAGLPAASSFGVVAGSPGLAWWKTDGDGSYLRDHLIWHLLEAGRSAAAEALACDLRWVGARLAESGAAATVADLSMAGTPRAARMWVAVTQAAHLLAPTEQTSAVVDILHSRVAADPDWGPQVAALRDVCRRPRLVNRWPLPDLPDPALRAVLEGHRDAVNAVCAVTVAGKDLLATASNDATVRIWDPATGQQLSVLEGHEGWVQWVCPVSVAGQHLLASAGWDATVRIWDPATGQQRTVLKGHQGAVDAVCSVTVAGQNLLATAGRHDDTVRIWDPATEQQRTVLEGYRDWVHSLCSVTVAGQNLLATADDDAMVRIWDPATGQQRTVLEGHQDDVNAVCPVTVAGQNLLASASDDHTVRIWDPAVGQQRTVLEGHQSAVEAVCPVTVADQDMLASGGRHDKTVRIWDPATGEQCAVLEGHSDWVRSVCPIIVAGQNLLASASDDATVRIWDPAVGQQGTALEGHQSEVEAVCRVTVAGQDLLATGGGWDTTVRIWDSATGQQRMVLEGHAGTVRAICPVTIAGQELLASAGDETVRIWDLATGQQRMVLEGHRGTIFAVCPVTVADQNLLATAAGDATVRIWDPATGQQHAVLESRDYVHSICPVRTAGQDLLATVVDATVRIWDPATGQQRMVLEGHAGRVRAVCPVTIAGQDLLASADDATVRIWDPATGQQRMVLEGYAGRGVRAVCAFTVAGQNLLAAVVGDATVRIWDPATGQVQALMRTEMRLRVCVQMSTEGLAVGGDGGLYGFDYLTDGGDPNSVPTQHRDGSGAQNIKPDNGSFQHYVEDSVIREAVLAGRPVTALCGWTWIPRKSAHAGDDLGNLPVCPRCKNEYDSMPP
jgi:WD40 repeat protein